MNTETLLMSEPRVQQDTSSTETGKRGRKSNWRGWQKRGRGGYRGRGKSNYSVANNTTNNVVTNENISETHPGVSWTSQESETHPGVSWTSQESINTVEQVVETNSLDGKEKSFRGRPWRQRGRGGWKKWGTNEINEEGICQDVNSQEKWPGRGRNRYKNRGRGKGKMQQPESYDQSEKNIFLSSAEDMQNCNSGLTRDDTEVTSIETDSSGINACRGRGFKEGRGYFRGKGRKKQYLNNEDCSPEEDGSSGCTDLSASGSGRARNNSSGMKDNQEDVNELNNRDFSQLPWRGRGGHRGRGQVHQRGSYIQKNKCSNRSEEIFSVDLQQDCDLEHNRNNIEIASTESNSTHPEAGVQACRGKGNKAGRGRGYFRGRGGKKPYFNNEDNNQEENSFKEWETLSGRGGGMFRAKDDSSMKYVDSVEKKDGDVTELNDVSYNNGCAPFKNNVRYATDDANISLGDVSIASEVNMFPKSRTRNRRGQWRNQYSENQVYRKNKDSTIIDEDNACAAELVKEKLNGFSNFSFEDRSNSNTNEHVMEKLNDSVPNENNPFPKRKRRNRRKKWKNQYDKPNNTQNIFAAADELEKNTVDDEVNCLDNNISKETKTNVQQPNITSTDRKPIQDTMSFENRLISNWLEIAKGGMPTYHGQYVQGPKQDLDTQKDNNKISLQDLFSKTSPTTNKGNVQTDSSDFAANSALFQAVDTASSQEMSLAKKTADVTISKNFDSVASTSVASVLPATITSTTVATCTAEAINKYGTASTAFTRNIQTPSTVTPTVSSSTKIKPGLIRTSRTPLKANLITTGKPLSNTQTTTSCNTVQHPTATSTASAKINSSVAMVSGTTYPMKTSQSTPQKQSLLKAAIDSHATVTSSSPVTISQTPDISLTAKSQTGVKNPVLSNSSSLDQVSATGLSAQTNLTSHKTSSSAAVLNQYLSSPTDGFTQSIASTTSEKRKTVSNYGASHMTQKRNTGNCNKLEYELSDECKLVIKSYGDIVKEKSELLVCVLGSYADMRKTKVGQAFLKEFPNHWQELQHTYRKNPFSPVLTVKNPQGFKSKAICHIILSPWNREESSDQIDIALHELFDVVNDLKIESISIPPLGCGLAFKFPPKYMVQWLLKHIKNMTIGGYLKKIVLLAPNSELFKEFKTQASRYFVIANTYYREEESIQTEDIFFNLMPKRGTLEYMNYLAQQETVFPSYWDLDKRNKTWWGFVANYFTRANKPYLVDVSDETKAAVKKLVVESQDLHVIGHGADAVGMNYSSINVIDVQRIEQPVLFEMYHKKRKEVLEKMIRKGFVCQDVGKITGSKGKVLTKTLLSDSMKDELYSEINEHYLFHGTKGKALENIIVNGFDPSCSKALSLFGQGIYTAEKSTKADQYTDEKARRSPNGTKLSLILARVLLGNVFVCDESHPRLESKVCRKLSKPPCMRCLEDLCFCGSEEHYDSVMGDGKWLFREFVVYEGCQSYPEYLITYQRM